MPARTRKEPYFSGARSREGRLFFFMEEKVAEVNQCGLNSTHLYKTYILDEEGSQHLALQASVALHNIITTVPWDIHQCFRKD